MTTNDGLTTQPPNSQEFLGFQEQHNAAMDRILFDLVLQLHGRGVIDARSLIAGLESGQDFAQAAYRKKQNPVLATMLGVLTGLVDASEQARSPRTSPDPGSSAT